MSIRGIKVQRFVNKGGANGEYEPEWQILIIRVECVMQILEQRYSGCDESAAPSGKARGTGFVHAFNVYDLNQTLKLLRGNVGMGGQTVSV